MQFEGVRTSEFDNKLLVRVGFLPTQFVIHVGNRKYDPEIGPQGEEQAEQRYRVCTARHSYSQAVPSLDQFLLANLFRQTFGKLVHGEMVQEPRCPPSVSVPLATNC